MGPEDRTGPKPEDVAADAAAEGETSEAEDKIIQGPAGDTKPHSVKVDAVEASQAETFPMAQHVEADEVVPHIPGVNSSEGDTPYVEDDSEKVIKDPSSAYDVAKYGHYDRSRAANTRRDVASEKAFKDRLRDVINDPRYLSHGFRENLRSIFRNDSDWVWGKPLPANISEWGLQSIRTLKEESGRGTEENADIGWNDRYDALHSSTDVMEGHYDPNAPFREESLESARRSDERAKRAEEWAEHLQKNPINKEYAEAHPNISLGVGGIMALEDLVETQNGRSSWDETDRDLAEGVFDKLENVAFGDRKSVV